MSVPWKWPKGRKRGAGVKSTSDVEGRGEGKGKPGAISSFRFRRGGGKKDE